MIDFIREIFQLSAPKVIAILLFVLIMIPIAAVILYYVVVIVGTIVVAAGVLLIAGLIVAYEKVRYGIINFLNWIIRRRKKENDENRLGRG